MHHKPSAIAEGYRPRSIDDLRPYLALIERFILDKAGVKFDPAKVALWGLARSDRMSEGAVQTVALRHTIVA